MLSVTRRSAAAGIIAAGLMAALLLRFQDTFRVFLPHETAIFLTALAACVLAGLGLAVKFRASAKYYPIGLTLFFVSAPLAMTAQEEILNSNYLSDLTEDLMWVDNYAVCLLLCLAVFALCGSVRAAVISISFLTFCFGTANMYVKEFKGSPLLPMDFTNSRTAAAVANQYDFKASGELLFSFLITLCLIALASRLAMPAARLKVRLALRLPALALVLAVCGVYYSTDLFSRMGYNPDFFNQSRGYEHCGAIREFVLNTKYLTVRKPAGYDPDRIDDIMNGTKTDSQGSRSSGAREESGPGKKHSDVSKKSSSSSSDDPYILETALRQQGASKQELAAGTLPQATSSGENNQSRTSSDEKTRKTAKTGGAGNTSRKPNVIVIMDEAFSDLSVLGDFDATKDDMPFLHSLKKDTIQGNSYVSVYGTGTSNTEFEFLTGNSMAFLPAGSNAYQLYVKNTQPGLTSQLKQQGYRAQAFHPYFRSDWNRPAVYRAMQFDDFDGIEEMFGSDIRRDYAGTHSSTVLKRELAEKYPNQDILLRQYVSDDYDFQRVIRYWKKRDRSQPFYLFNVTMQNHSPYAESQWDFDHDLKLTSPKEDPKAEQYLNLVRRTDAACARLIRYFRKVKEPTVILFFGDHQPFIEDSFYESVLGDADSSIPNARIQKKYISHFFLWANYDIPEGHIEHISCNYLQTLLQQTAGLPMTDYSRYLARLYAKYPVITAQGCLDENGKFFAASNPPDSAEEDIDGYRKICYNNLIDEKHRQEKLYRIHE